MMQKIGILILTLTIVGCGSAQAQRPVPKTAATVIYEVNKGNGGCPGRTDPLGWYMNGINDGHGWSCINGTWVESTPTPVVVPAKPLALARVVSPDEIQIWSPTDDKPYSIFVRGKAPVSNSVKGGPTDKPLKFNGDAVAQALYDWGLKKNEALGYEWVDDSQMAFMCRQPQPVAACMNFGSGKFTVFLSKGPYGGNEQFNNNIDLYNNIIQGETYRLIYNEVEGRLDRGGDGFNSVFWKELGNKPSPYRFVSE